MSCDCINVQVIEEVISVIVTDEQIVSGELTEIIICESQYCGGIEEAPKDGNQYARQDGDWTEVSIPVVPVTSVFGRTGDVVAGQNDYTWNQINKTVSSLADITTRKHSDLTEIGNNTHPQIDSHIARTDVHFLDAPADSKQYARQNNNWVEVQASGGGSPFLNFENITFAALQTKIQNAEIEVGKYYRITDYYSLNSAGFGEYYQSPIEPIIVQGLTANQVSLQSYSDTHKNDVILYDITDNQINDSVNLEYDTGDNNGTINVLSTTTDTVVVDQEPILNDNFYFYAEDNDGGEIEYEFNGLGSDFTVTDNGNSSWTITDLTGDINFAQPDYSYIEGEWDLIINFPGKIIYREDPQKKIVCYFDFRNHKYYRAKADLGSVSTYDSGTTYSVRKIVKYNGTLYASKNNDNHGHTPTDQNFWHRILGNVADYYLFAENGFYNAGGNINISQQQSDRALVPVFAKQNGSTFVYDDSRVKNTKLIRPDTIFINFNDAPVVENCEFNTEKFTVYASITFSKISNGSNCTFTGPASYVDFGYISSLFVAMYLQNSSINNASSTMFVGCASMTIDKISNSLLKVQRVVIGNNNRQMALSGSDMTFGNNNSDISMRNGNFISFGNSNQRIEFYMHPLANVKFGDQNKYLKFTGNNVSAVEFKDRCGKYGHWHNFTSNLIASYIGTSCFWNGQSTVIQLTNVTLQGNNERVKIPRISNSVFGWGASDITSSSVDNCVFGARCFHINFNNTKMYGCVFDPAVQNLSMGTSDLNKKFTRNQVHASNTDYGSSATHIFKNYTCEIINLEASGVNLPVKLMYYDNTGVQQIVDPDT